MEKDLKKVCKKFLWTALLLTVGLVLGIPGVVFGAVLKIWLLMAFCILLCVGGIYVMPIMWVKFGENKSLLKLMDFIVVDKVLSLSTLAVSTGDNVNMVRKKVTKLISSRYLVGYILKNDGTIEQIEKKEKIVRKNKCPNCGAQMEMTSGKAICHYCNSTFDTKL